jgi:hypothetical protein
LKVATLAQSLIGSGQFAKSMKESRYEENISD